MKRFKIGFLPVIAILATGLTAATRPEVFKKLSPKDQYICTTSDYTTVTFYKDDGAGGLTLEQLDSFDFCGTTYCGDPRGIMGTNLSNAVSCYGIGEVFCCVREERNHSLCGAPFTTKFTVICKPEP